MTCMKRVIFYGECPVAMFGTDERVYQLTDVDLEGPNGEDLVLCRKSTTTFIFAGVYFKDDGYVLGVKGDDEKYIRLSASEIRTYQTEQLLPNPLPPYKVTVIEYIFGYLFYIAIFLSIAYYTIKDWIQRRFASHRTVGGESSETSL